jgi:hypothetical protein
MDVTNRTTKQGVRDLNTYGPRKKPDDAGDAVKAGAEAGTEDGARASAGVDMALNAPAPGTPEAEAAATAPIAIAEIAPPGV